MKLKFYWDKEREEAHTEYLPAQHIVGQSNILHGAIQMGLFDEIMGWTCYAIAQAMAVTTGLNIKLLSPTYIQKDKINVVCRVISQAGNKVKMQAKLLNIEGEVCTVATGNFHILPANKYQKLLRGV